MDCSAEYILQCEKAAEIQKFYNKKNIRMLEDFIHRKQDPKRKDTSA